MLGNRLVLAGSLILCIQLLFAYPSDAQDMPAPPPEPAGDAIFGVMSIDVAPSHLGQGIAMLKAYQAAVHKQTGIQSVKVLQQVGWPNRFIVYEQWRDRSAYDGNQKAAQTVRFCLTLRTISNATCDRRAYYEVSLGTPRPESSGALYMMVHLDVFPAKLREFFAISKNMAAAARGADGNLRYEVSSGVSTPWNYMTLFASWRSRKAFDDYENSEDERAFREQVAPVLGSPYDQRLYVAVN